MSSPQTISQPTTRARQSTPFVPARLWTNEAFLSLGFAARGLLLTLYARAVGGYVPASPRALAIVAGCFDLAELATLAEDLMRAGLVERTSDGRYALAHWTDDRSVARNAARRDAVSYPTTHEPDNARPTPNVNTDLAFSGRRSPVNTDHAFSGRQSPDSLTDGELACGERAESVRKACGDTPPNTRSADSARPRDRQERVRASAGAGGNSSTSARTVAQCPTWKPSEQHAPARSHTPAQEGREFTEQERAAVARWQRERAIRAPRAIVAPLMLAELAREFGEFAFVAALRRHIDETDPAVWTPNPLRFLRRRCEWARDDEPAQRPSRRSGRSAGDGFLVRSPPPPPPRDLDAEDAADLADFLAAQGAR